MKTRPQTRLKATIENRLHGCGLRRSPEGERKALWSRPQTRFPLRRAKVKSHKTQTRRASDHKNPPTENSPNLLKFGLSPGRGRLLTPRPKEGKGKEKGGEKE